jgi:hypothetical protein
MCLFIHVQKTIVDKLLDLLTASVSKGISSGWMAAA